MSFSKNRVILDGRLGKDPEIRTTPGGTSVASFSVATSETWKDKSTGDKKELTEWHSCTAWGMTGELIAKHAAKGDAIFIEGRLRTEKWQDRAGNDRYTTKIIVDDFIIHSKGGSSGASRTPNEDTPEAQRAASRAPAAGNDSAPQQQSADFDDDIPF